MVSTLLFAVLLGAGPADDTRLVDPPPRLDGAWKLLAGEKDGAPLTGQSLAGYTVTLQGNRALIEYRSGGIVEAADLDFTVDGDSFRTGCWFHGRYRLENGRLHLSIQDQSSTARFVLYRAGN